MEDQERIQYLLEKLEKLPDSTSKNSLIRGLKSGIPNVVRLAVGQAEMLCWESPEKK